MRRTLRRSPQDVYVTYEHGGCSGNLCAEHAKVEFVDGYVILSLDLSGNLRVHDKRSHRYQEARELCDKAAEVSSVQLNDDHTLHGFFALSHEANRPPMRLVLEVGACGDFTYDISARTLDGCAQFDVLKMCRA